MTIPSIGTGALSALKLLAQYSSPSNARVDADGDRDRSASVDTVQLSPQAKLLAAQKQGDQSLWVLLAQALQSGDLSGAQTAFTNLEQRFAQNSSGATSAAGTATPASGASQTNPISQDLNALGQALKSGDVTAAQDAFDQLQQDFQQLQAKHHHRHRPPADAGSSSTSIDIQVLLLNLGAGGGTAASPNSSQAGAKA